MYKRKWLDVLINKHIRYSSISRHSSSYVCLPPPKEHLPEIAQLNDNLHTHDDFYRFSIEHCDQFWGTLGKSRLKWSKTFNRVQNHDVNNAKFRWFEDGQLNVSVNCLDRHVAVDPNRTALIWEKDEPNNEVRISYGELLNMVCQIANVLLSHGVKKSDRVTIYLPMSPYLVACMLACARIGAIHNVVFAGFSAESLAARINDADSKTVITADQGVRAGKIIELKQIMDKAMSKCKSVERVFIVQRTGGKVSMGPKDILLEKEMSKQKSTCTPVDMNSEDSLFMLYTSGSTGKPKGLVHSQAGYLLYASLTHKLVFDYRQGEIFGCMADIGWITGHSYVVYGPLANGATSVLFESVPVYPNPGRYWETVERLRINQFYGSPTAYRLLHSHSNEFIKKYDLSSLRVLGSVGEPINHEAWQWLHKEVGKEKCMVVDTWWQTETGGICVAPCPADNKALIKPAIAMRPFYGIKPVLMDSKGTPVSNYPSSGALCLSLENVWPGVARTIWGDHDRYVQTYFSQFPGLYFTGDGAQRDKQGYFHLTGRIDDVINVSGHRLGTAEVEDAMDDHPALSESAVVGFPHKIKGEGVFAYVSLKDNVSEQEDKIISELKQLVKRNIASYAVPDKIVIVDALPKTRSGKIMRRILRKIAAGDSKDLGDLSTLSDPNSVNAILKKLNM